MHEPAAGTPLQGSGNSSQLYLFLDLDVAYNRMEKNKKQRQEIHRIRIWGLPTGLLTKEEIYSKSVRNSPRGYRLGHLIPWLHVGDRWFQECYIFEGETLALTRLSGVEVMEIQARPSRRSQHLGLGVV